MQGKDDYPELPLKEREQIKRREKKRRPKMEISGRGLFTIARIIQEKAEGLRSIAGKGRRKKRRRRKKRKKRRK